MRTIKLTISYDGTKYSGWQIQKNSPSVQETLEKAVKKVFKKTHKVHGSGRTDSGVHAKGQVAHFKISEDLPVSGIRAALNGRLPKDVAVTGVEEVPHDFHSRFSVKSKIYRYHILNFETPDPFLEKYAWRVSYKLNTALMRREAAVLEGRHDFKSFQASDSSRIPSNIRGSIRKIFRIKIKKKNHDIVIEIEGDGFLYNMVRNIAGTLVDIGRGYLPPGSMKKILKAKDRTQAGPTAPAKGLFLVKVKY